MIIYLKGYYGYKNLGDELLLFGVLKRISTEFSPTTILIESGDIVRLQKWLDDNVRACPQGVLLKPVTKRSQMRLKKDLVVFGGGEVVTDARPIPYNGRTYIAGFLQTILKKKYMILGGVGTVKNKTTPFLYKFFLGRAQKIVVRDKHSYKVAKKYNKNTQLYRDFCYDFLELYTQKKGKLPKRSKSQRVIVNVNKYIWNNNTIEQIKDTVKSSDEQFFLPGEMGSDDVFFDYLKKDIPTLILLDRTTMPVYELIETIFHANRGIGARLHVLLLLDYLGVSYTPLVYQEKINHVLGVRKT